MKCPNCGGENPDNAYFCGECGAQIGSVFSAPPGAVEAEPPPSEPAEPVTPPPYTPASYQPPAGTGATQHPAATPPPSPYQPGAGLAPPSVPPPPPPGGQLPYAPPGAPPQYPPPGAYGAPPYGGYGMPPFGMPPYGNTSGMGEGYPVPPQASGWTFAGCLPFALFAFLNGITTWGAIGLVLYFLGFYIVYSIYIGIKGREMAWRSRRFDSVQQFDDTMRAWNNWGIGCLAAGIVAFVLYIVFIFAVTGMAVMSGNDI